MRALLQLRDNSVFLQFYLNYLVLLRMSIMLSKFRLSAQLALCLALCKTAEEQGSCSKEAYRPRAAMGATKWCDTSKHGKGTCVKGCLKLWMEREQGECSQCHHQFACLTGLCTCPGTVSLLGDVLPGWGSALAEVTPGTWLSQLLLQQHTCHRNTSSWHAWWLCEMHSLPPSTKRSLMA